MKTHYELIGIQPAAEADEVKRAFRREIARYHPDKVQHLGTEFQEIAATRAAALTEAYRVLMDAELRQRYDDGLLTDRPGAPDRGPSPPEQESSASVADRPPEARAPQNQSDVVGFVRRAVSARLEAAVAAAGGTMATGRGFDWICVIEGARPLFRKAEPSVRVAVRIVPAVDAASLSDAWKSAIRLAADGETLCLMLLGSGLAPVRELSAAITELRNKTRRTAPVVIPVDVRDWEALVPSETPPAMRVLLDRLRKGD